MKNIYINNLKLFLEYFLTVIGLPCGYRSKSKIFLILLLTLIVLSISYSSGIYKYLINNDEIVKYLIISVVIYSMFLKFNLIVRMYNIFIRSLKYFYSSKLNNKIIICYYFYNIFCLVLSTYLIYKLDNKLIEYNIMLYEVYSIYSVLISGILGYLYIDYLSNIRVNIYKIKSNKLTLFLTIIFSLSLIFTLSIVFVNLLDLLTSANFRLFNPILNDGGNSENTQANSNSQSSVTNANQQTNQNRQVNPGKSGSSNTKSLALINKNKNIQGNVNEQINR